MAYPTLSEIRAANASVDDNGYVLLTLTRPLGPPLAWAWMRVGLSPRHVNYLSVVVGLVILGLCVAAGRGGLIAATALCFVWQAIDVSDGTMARALGIRDNFGGFVDYSSGMLIVAFLPFFLGIGAYLAPDGSLAALLARFAPGAAPPPAATAIMGGAISVISLYMRLINRVLQIRFGESLSEPGGGPAQGRRAAHALREAIKNLESIGGLQAAVFFLGAAFGILEAVLFLYFLFYCVLLVGFAASVYRNFRGRRAYL